MMTCEQILVASMWRCKKCGILTQISSGASGVGLKGQGGKNVSCKIYVPACYECGKRVKQTCSANAESEALT